jgi:hypothetical protein
MWEFQDKFAAKQKRLKRDAQNKKRRSQRGEFHLYRVPIEIRLLGGTLGAPKVTLTGRLLSTEFTSTNMDFFTTHRLNEGTPLSITVQDGSRLFIRATVTECKRYKLEQTIIQEFPHPYRVRVEFDFKTQNEVKTLEKFAAQFYANYVAGTNKPRP